MGPWAGESWERSGRARYISLQGLIPRVNVNKGTREAVREEMEDIFPTLLNPTCESVYSCLTVWVSLKHFERKLQKFTVLNVADQFEMVTASVHMYRDVHPVDPCPQVPYLCSYPGRTSRPHSTTGLTSSTLVFPFPFLSLEPPTHFPLSCSYLHSEWPFRLVGLQ